MKVKKSLGQHFLTSQAALAKSVAAGEISPDDVVLEIGPGNGALTKKLLETAGRVVAIEKDGGLFAHLEERFSREIAEKRLVLVHGDALKLDFSHHTLAEGAYKLVANIPYYITGAILEHFLQGGPQPKRAVLLVQKEVAERIVAKENKESVLSISVKAYGRPKIVSTVKAGSFSPVPKVDSAILLIENISRAFFTKNGIDEGAFFRLVKAGFAHKRKFLSKNLAVATPVPRVRRAFAACAIDEQARAEDIRLKDWCCIARSIDRERSAFPPPSKNPPQ